MIAPTIPPIPPTSATKPPIDFAAISKQFTDGTKAAQDYFTGITKGFLGVNKASVETVKSVKTVDRSINVLGATFKGTTKELIQVGTALGVVGGTLTDLSQKSNLVIAPLKGVLSALSAVSDKAKGLELAQSIGVDTSGIQKLELFRAGVLGNTEALQQFRLSSQTAGIAFTLNLTKLNTILKTSKDELKGVGAEARKLSKDLGGTISSVDILAGQYQIASAGFTKAIDSNAIAKAAGQLSVVGFNDFFSTADLVTKSLRAYGLQASKAGEVAAKLNAIVEVGITTIPELAAGFGETAVVANAFGISLDQVGAAVATITSQGSSTPEALTGIEALFRTLANQSPQATKALAALSLNGQKVRFDVATVQAKGLGNALNDVFKAAGGNVEVLREIIPESRALQAALALASQGGASFADALDNISSATPTKLGSLFSEVQDDPSIKLKAIATKAEEVVGSVASTYEKFTDSAINSLAQFVSFTEAIVDNPVAQFLASGFLAVGDAIGKVAGVFGALGGAALSVIGTLVSINIFNNLFNGGLIRQGKLISEAILGLKDFRLAAVQALGVDTSKSVLDGLGKQLDNLKGKTGGLQGLVDINPSEANKSALEENQNKIKGIEDAVRGVRKEANKPFLIALKGIDEAVKEVKQLEAELAKLDANDPAREGLLNKQSDAIGRAGEERLNAEQQLKRQQKEGTLTPQQADQRRRRANNRINSIGKSAGANQAAFDSVSVSTTTSTIVRELEAEKAKGAKADSKRIANLSGSLEKLNQGYVGVLDSAGKLTQETKRTTNFGQAAALGLAKGWDRVTGSFSRSKTELTGVGRALELAVRSENINNFANGAGKLLTSIPAGVSLAVKGIKGAVVQTGKFGVELLSNFINPLSAGLAVIGLATVALQQYNEGLAFQAETGQKFAEIERAKTDAIRKTTEALQDQAKIKQLVAGGLTEKDAQKQITKDKKEAEIRKAIPNISADRQVRLRNQLQTGDFRDADTFASESLRGLTQNKLGLGNDNGVAKLKTDARNTATVALTGAATVAGTILGAQAGAALGSAIPGIGTLLGAAAGAAFGLLVSEGLRKAQNDQQIAEVKAEFLARRRQELEAQFKPSEAVNPEERAKRQEKVEKGVRLADVNFDAAKTQQGLDNNVIKELENSKDNRFKAFGANLANIRDEIAESSALLAEVDKSFKENKIPERFFNTPELTAKINALLAGTSEATTDDLQLVNANFKARLDGLTKLKEEADRQAEAAKSSGSDAAASEFKKQATDLAKIIETESQQQVKIRAKVEISNIDIQNAIRNKQGAFGTILTREASSAKDAVEKILKSVNTDATTEDKQAVPGQIQALQAALDNLTDTDPAKALAIIKQVRGLLSGGDLIELSSEQLVTLQNTVAANANKLAQQQIAKFESIVRRFQSLAGQEGEAGRQGQDLLAKAELAVIDQKIKAQEDLVATTNAPLAKEIAQNDLIQLQLDKKTKTIEARVAKEIQAADLLFTKEKARLDLAKADLDIKKQALETFGLATETVDTDSAKNSLAQFQAEAKKQRDSLITQQKAGAETAANTIQAQFDGINSTTQASTLSSTDAFKSGTLNNALGLNTSTEYDKSKYKKQYDDVINETNKLEADAIRSINTQADAAVKPVEKKLVIATEAGSAVGFNSFKDKIEQFRQEKQAIEAARQSAIKKIEDEGKARRDNATAINESNKKGFASNATEAALKAEADAKDKAIKAVPDNRAKIEAANKAELERLDAANKKQEQALQFQIDLAAEYNAIIKPLERQNDLLSSTTKNIGNLAGVLTDINTLYVSQAGLQAGIQAQTATQILTAKRLKDTELQKLDIREKLLQKNGLLDASAKKQIEDSRAVINTQFQQDVLSIKFEADQKSIDGFAKKLQSTVEGKLKSLGLQRSGLQTFAGSFEDEESKDAVQAKKLAAAVGIDIAVQEAALAEQLLKIEQEKILAQLTQNDLQLKFLDIQLQVQATQTKDKELLDSIASARSSISGARANIQQEIADTPARFAEQEKIQRRQSTLAVSSASLDFAKEFGKPKELKSAQDQFLAVNQLSLEQRVGDTSVNNAVNNLKATSAMNKQEFEKFRGRGVETQQAVQPVRREADGSITNIPPINITVNASTNASAADIGKIVKQELLTVTREFKR